MFTIIKRASLAAAVVTAIPALAQAQPIAYGTAPVSVTSCTTSDRTTLVAPVSRAGLLIHSVNDVALRYVNTAGVAAISVTFLVNDGNRTSRLTANGSFAPGVTIRRNLEAAADGAAGSASCTVAQVRFADGSAWDAQAPRLLGER